MRNSDQRCQPWTVHPPCGCLCPPERCQCDQCSRPPVPGGRGFLLPRIIACGREWQRGRQITLQVEGLPLCPDACLTLTDVRAVGEPLWTQRTDPCRRALCLHVTIPLACLVRDEQGCQHEGRVQVELDTCLPLTTPPAECWRDQMMLLPCVRLMCPGVTGRGGCFDAQLEIRLESYLIRWEPCLPPGEKPACPPPLPLYPQPCPPRWR